MVSKVLIGIQEQAMVAAGGADGSEDGDDLLADLIDRYRLVRSGLGFMKSAAEQGAFPTDPHSHTPAHAGAQQPGMTGQVKEEVLTRFGELGIRVSAGKVNFVPMLLRRCEFMRDSKPFCYLDVQDNWQELAVPENGLAFTWCQVPIVYVLGETDSLEVQWSDGQQQTLPSLALPAELSSEIFMRNGKIQQLTLQLKPDVLFTDPVPI